MSRSFKPLIAAGFLSLLLSGCATSALVRVTPAAAPAAFKGASATTSTSTPAPKGAWWLIFSDPVLNDLMARAMEKNNDVKLAAAHLEQAQALLKASHADFWPQVDASYSPTRTTYLQLPGKAVTSHALDLNLSYEVDLNGRLSKAAQAAHLDTQSSASLLRDTQLLVQSRVAESYFALRALDEDRAIVADTLSAYRGSLQVTQHRFEEGDVAELDVARLQTEVDTTQAEGVALNQQRAQLLHALAVLVGEPASSFDLNSTIWAKEPWAGNVPVIPAGLPADVLQQRPDVAAAYISLEAAQKRVGIAKAAWLPSLNLTASGGYASSDLNTLFNNGSHAWSLAAILSQAVFDGGRRRAGIDYAKGGLDGAFASYQQSVLTALADVEDQLSDLSYLQQQQTSEDQALAASGRALAMSQSRYTNGSSSQLEVLDAQRSQLAIRRQALRVRAARYQSTVGLIRALGGAWS